jgi:OOP family OmpA-OmpF porin
VTQSVMVNWKPRATPAVARVTLPGGAVLSLQEGSLTHTLAMFLGDTAMTMVPQTFIFDHLNFYSGTAHLTTESVPTVESLLAILQAYPTADVRLDGHTDDVGNAESNKKLSLDRAAAVQEALVNGGIDATRVTTAGYGQEYPLASNETEEGRAKNQRLELVVVKK